MLEITAQAINNDSMLKRIKRFYLRDIGKLGNSTEVYQANIFLKSSLFYENELKIFLFCCFSSFQSNLTVLR